MNIYDRLLTIFSVYLYIINFNLNEYIILITYWYYLDFYENNFTNTEKLIINYTIKKIENSLYSLKNDPQKLNSLKLILMIKYHFITQNRGIIGFISNLYYFDINIQLIFYQFLANLKFVFRWFILVLILYFLQRIFYCRIKLNTKRKLIHFFLFFIFYRNTEFLRISILIVIYFLLYFTTDAWDSPFFFIKNSKKRNRILDFDKLNLKNNKTEMNLQEKHLFSTETENIVIIKLRNLYNFFYSPLFSILIKFKNNKDKGKYILSHIIILSSSYVILQTDYHLQILISICFIDSIASMTGKYFNKTDKSIIGLIMGFLSGILIHFLIFRDNNYIDYYIFISLSEYLTEQNDNLVLPFVSIIYFFYRPKLSSIFYYIIDKGVKNDL